MFAIHLVMAILAAIRLTELVVTDKITEFVRGWGPFWNCGRCVSVWASALVLLVFWYWPWGNWPLALSMLYIFRVELFSWLFYQNNQR